MAEVEKISSWQRCVYKKELNKELVSVGLSHTHTLSTMNLLLISQRKRERGRSFVVCSHSLLVRHSV